MDELPNRKWDGFAAMLLSASYTGSVCGQKGDLVPEVKAQRQTRKLGNRECNDKLV